MKRIREGLGSELCARQLLSAQKQLSCSKKARERSQGALTGPAGRVHVSAFAEISPERVGSPRESKP